LSPDSPIETTINTSPSYQESVTLEGSVWDPVQKKAVIAAVIAVKGTNIGAITDNKGHFSVKVPRSEEKIELAINHTDYQLHSYQIVPNQSRAGLLVEIKSTTLPTTTTTELTKKKKRPKRRRSRRRMIYMGCPIF
jgi:hypothetical protein